MAEIILLRFGSEICPKIAAGLVNRGHRAIQIEELNELYDTLMKKNTALVLINFLPDEKWPYMVATKIRKTVGISYTKILAVVPKVSMGVLEAIFASGVNECFNKPFRMGALLDKVEDVLASPKEDTQDNGNNKDNAIAQILQTTLDKICEEGRQLADVAEVLGGIAAHDPRAKRVTCPGPEWTPTIIANAVNQFHLDEEREFYLLRKDLMRRVPKEEEYRVDEKILVKRTVLPVSAAVDTSRQPFASGLYGIQTVRGLSCSYLCCVLNSRYCQFFFNRYRPPADGLRGVYLARKDLEALPLVIPDMSDQMPLVDISHRLAAISPKTRNASRMIERGKLLAEMNRAVFDIFGFNDEAIKELTNLHF